MIVPLLVILLLNYWVLKHSKLLTWSKCADWWSKWKKSQKPLSVYEFQQDIDENNWSRCVSSGWLHYTRDIFLTSEMNHLIRRRSLQSHTTHYAEAHTQHSGCFECGCQSFNPSGRHKVLVHNWPAFPFSFQAHSVRSITTFPRSPVSSNYCTNMADPRVRRSINLYWFDHNYVVGPHLW